MNENISNAQILREIEKLPSSECEAITSTDMVRIAYEWLDAQRKLKHPHWLPVAQKHLIERWGGRYIPAPAVEVAARLHPEIKGIYPYLNISACFIRPHPRRLANIAEAGIHPNYSAMASADDYQYSKNEA